MMAYKLVFFWAYPSEEVEDHNFELIICYCIQLTSMTELDISACSNIHFVERNKCIWVNVVVLDFVEECNNEVHSRRMESDSTNFIEDCLADLEL